MTTTKSESRPSPEPESAPEWRRLYVGLHLKLFFVIAIAMTWAGFSLWLSLPWIETLGQSITVPLATPVIFGIAIIPGYLNANLIASPLGSIRRRASGRPDQNIPPKTTAGCSGSGGTDWSGRSGP